HGTACAGLIAAAAGNSFCIVGAAPLAKLGIVKMIGYPITISQEAEALMAFLSQGVHVYSNSWGPSDDGTTTGGPSPLATQAIKYGTTS
ncbi:Proprotein convertase subtilisin kexin type 5, partial [Cichlidogyrus casuarinus]